MFNKILIANRGENVHNGVFRRSQNVHNVVFRRSQSVHNGVFRRSQNVRNAGVSAKPECLLREARAGDLALRG